jgi:hypothetical protein
VAPRASFETDWRTLASSLATPAAQEIKRVMAGVGAAEAARAFARLWVADEHWTAAEKVMNRGG